MASNSRQCTKVYYYFDDDKTPYLSEVPVPPERLTLAEFKKVFNRRNYKYYYQAYDADIQRFVYVDSSLSLICWFREAKYEIAHDNELLKRNSRNHYELHLQSTATAGGSNSSTTPSSATLQRYKRLAAQKHLYNGDDYQA